MALPLSSFVDTSAAPFAAPLLPAVLLVPAAFLLGALAPLPPPPPLFPLPAAPPFFLPLPPPLLLPVSQSSSLWGAAAAAAVDLAGEPIVGGPAGNSSACSALSTVSRQFQSFEEENKCMTLYWNSVHSLA